MAAEIPKWIIEYDKIGYKSSAGLAVRALVEIIEKRDREFEAISKDRDYYKEQITKLEKQIEDHEQTIRFKDTYISQLQDEKEKINLIISGIEKDLPGGYSYDSDYIHGYRIGSLDVLKKLKI